MTIILRESDVEALVGVEDAFAAVEDALREQGRGQAENRPRQRIFVPNGVLQVMAGGMPDDQGPSGPVIGFKAYTSFAGKTRFVVLLYSARNGELLALIEADRLGQLRTGAASGVAAKYMARKDARMLGVIGSGWQAETQVTACCLARPFERVLVYSRDAGRREAFAQRLRDEFAGGRRVEVEAVDSAQAAVEAADVLATITGSRSPVFEGAWVRPGQLIIGAGSNHPKRVELPAGVANRCAVIAVDDLAQAKVESGDLIAAVERGETSWEAVAEIGEIVAGKRPGRTSDQDVTLFESHGLALWDVALARRAYDKARAAGRGDPLRLWGE